MTRGDVCADSLTNCQNCRVLHGFGLKANRMGGRCCHQPRKLYPQSGHQIIDLSPVLFIGFNQRRDGVFCARLCTAHIALQRSHPFEQHLDVAQKLRQQRFARCMRLRRGYAHFSPKASKHACNSGRMPTAKRFVASWLASSDFLALSDSLAIMAL